MTIPTNLWVIVHHWVTPSPHRFIPVSLSHTFPSLKNPPAPEFGGPDHEPGCSWSIQWIYTCHRDWGWELSAAELEMAGVGMWARMFSSLMQLWKLYALYSEFALKKEEKKINKMLILSMLTVTNLVSVWQKREDKNSHLIFSLQIVRLQTAFALKDDSLLCSHSWIFVMSCACLKKITV